MSNLLIDNWTLQETAHILKSGFDDSKTNIYTSGGLFPTEVPSAAVKIESLFNFLLNVVLRDNLFIDHDWTEAWIGVNAKLDEIHKSGIILTKKFELDDNFFMSRDHILENLVHDKEIIDRHYENVEYWRIHKRNKYKALPIVITGTMGYLTRSNILSTDYSPHPTRSAYLQSTPLFQKPFNAFDKTLNFISDERHNILKSTFENDEFINSKLILAPILIEIIESSSSVEDMLKSALQMRKDFKKFRKYLTEFQVSIDKGDVKRIQKYKKVLDDVGQIKGSEKKYGTTELGLGVAFLKLSKMNLRSLLVSTRNKFGIRAEIKKMIFKKASKGTWDKFFNLFDEKNLTLQNEIKEYFRFSQNTST